jgi:hypothetical protein
MRDLEDEERIKAYMAAKMTHIKMYNECMNLADGLDVEKFAELVRADERAKREWQELDVNEVIQVINENITDPSPELLQELYGLVASVDIWLQEKNSGN